MNGLVLVLAYRFNKKINQFSVDESVPRLRFHIPGYNLVTYLWSWLLISFEFDLPKVYLLSLPFLRLEATGIGLKRYQMEVSFPIP